MFIALRPPVAQLTELEDFLEAVGLEAAGVSVVSPARWHITLSFMPAVEASHHDALHDALVSLAPTSAPMELVLRGAGSFARGGTSAPIWIGVDGDLAALEDLALGCRAAGHRSGARVESPKQYRPHLTLSRRRPPEHGDLWMARLDEFRGTPWLAGEILLIESILGGHRRPVRHTTLGSYRMKG